MIVVNGLKMFYLETDGYSADDVVNKEVEGKESQLSAEVHKRRGPFTLASEKIS